jgi:hypothetical protein
MEIQIIFISLWKYIIEEIFLVWRLIPMYGRIIKIDKETATILTDENRVIVVNPLFLPINFMSGDIVELAGDKIVLR